MRLGQVFDRMTFWNMPSFVKSYELDVYHLTIGASVLDFNVGVARSSAHSDTERLIHRIHRCRVVSSQLRLDIF